MMNDYNTFIDECAKLSWEQLCILVRRLGLPLASFSEGQSRARRADLLFQLCKKEGIRLTTRDILDSLQVISNQTSCDGIALALSGGGLRATFFHLGVLVYYRATNQLEAVRCITAVSGGSILAAHAALHWDRLLKANSFVSAMGDLVRFARTNVRNRVLIPWLWSVATGWRWLGSRRARWRRSRTGRLVQVYLELFGSKPITDLNGDLHPLVAFVATDILNAIRVYLSHDEIRLFNISDNRSHPSPNCPIDMISVAFAVAASSCFPPVFRALDFDHRTLGVLHQEYAGFMRLQDGGVHDNLGLRALNLVSSVRSMSFTSVCASSAANPMKPTKPKTGIISDLSNALRIHSSGENVEIAHELLAVGHASIVTTKLTDRVSSANMQLLPTDVQTSLMLYRTDLDSPSESEMYALMAHGFEVAADRHGNTSDSLMRQGKEVILAILESGRWDKLRNECGKNVALQAVADNLNASSLKGCGTRPKKTVIFHVFLILLFYLALSQVIFLLRQ